MSTQTHTSGWGDGGFCEGCSFFKDAKAGTIKITFSIDASATGAMLQFLLAAQALTLIRAEYLVNITCRQKFLAVGL
jgi:hypothetical protein